MKIKGIPLLILTSCLTFQSCEIEDDFGKNSASNLNPAVSLGSDAAQWLAWKDDQTILYWSFGTLDIKSVDINSRVSSTFLTLKPLVSNESYEMLSLLSSGKLLALINWYDDISQQSRNYLSLINTLTGEVTKLADDFAPDYYHQNYASHATKLAFAVRNQMQTTDVWLYDLSSGNLTFVGTGFPFTFSPDGSQLLCHDYYSASTYLYNVAEQTQVSTPFTLNAPDVSKVCWNENGIIEVYESYDYQSYVIKINNKATNTSLQRSSAFSTQSIFISPSGEKLMHGSTSCLSPYLKLCPSQDNKVTLYMMDTNSNDDREMISEKVSPNGAGPIQIDKLGFSPDETKIAFIKYGALFLSQ